MSKRNILGCLDGSAILNACYFGTLPQYILDEKDKEKRKQMLLKLKKNSKGQYIEAVEASIKVLFKMLREQSPTHFAVAWDTTRDTFRRDIYPDYKGTREEPDIQIIEQFETAQTILKEMGIPQFYCKTYEADDYLGSLAKRFEEEIPVYLYTKDKDALQLVSDRTKLWLISSKANEWCLEYGIDRAMFNMPHNAFEFNPEYVKEIFGVYPEQIVDLKALLGDRGDNIPGVDRVGVASAMPLINHYGTIENLFDELKDLSKDDLAEIKRMWKDDLDIKRSPINILLKEESKEKAVLSKKLAQIVKDIDLKVSLEDLKLNIDINNVENILKEYGISANTRNIA